MFFVCGMDIYELREDSYLMQKYVKKYAEGRVLDLGTGSGIQALTVAESKKVQLVLAVDINKRAIEQLKQKIKRKKIKKIKTLPSDLFSQIKGKFDTIIFNPPYLPQDKGITDQTIYGGKKGYEISERFFKEVPLFLTEKGKILFLFSTLTNKPKIEEVIAHQLLEFKELGTQKLAFEELFVYEVKKSKLLQKLEKKGLSKIQYFTHGRRGDIFTGIYKNKKVALKLKRKESQAKGRIQNEAQWLKILNKYNIGPKYIYSNNYFLIYSFVKGDFILDWIQKNSGKKILGVLIKVLRQCFQLDKLGLAKEEMHHPQKHIIINSLDEPILIDFERCHRTKKPKNITQFVEFICRIKRKLAGFEINVGKLRALSKEYKNNPNSQNLENIINSL